MNGYAGCGSGQQDEVLAGTVGLLRESGAFANRLFHAKQLSVLSQETAA